MPPLSLRTKDTFHTPGRRRYPAAARAENGGNPQRAAVLYRKAALGPEPVLAGAASIALGNLLRREGLPDAAREAYESGSTARMPELRALSRVNLARLHLAAGRRADAVAGLPGGGGDRAPDLRPGGRAGTRLRRGRPVGGGGVGDR